MSFDVYSYRLGRRNLEGVIEHAKWEAEMARKPGRRWFELRDGWLIRAYEAD